MATFRTSSSNYAETAPATLDDDRQIVEEASEHNAVFWIEKGIANSFYYFDETVGRLTGYSQREIDLVLLEQAKDLGPLTQFKSADQMQRFNAVMDHFLSGSGRSMYFKLAELLNSCEGARRRVSQAISFRLAHHSDVIFGHPSCDLPSHVDTSSGKPIKYSIYQFPIHQRDYKNTDWQYALGTFGVMWEPLRRKTKSACVGPLCSSKVGDDWIDAGTLVRTRSKSPRPHNGTSEAPPTHAKIWGSKIWRWHSATDRASEAAHQAAYRLVQSGLLHNFWLVGEPCIVEISTGSPVSQPA